jgi:hypothetical protein
MALSTLRSRELVVLILVVCGFTLIIDYFVQIPILRGIVDELKVWAVLVAAFSWGVGFFRYIQNAVIKTRTRAPGWPIMIYGAVLVLVMSYFGVFYGVRNPGYDWMFNYVLQPVRTATVALTAPFIFSAGFRAFRAKNLEATLFLVAGLLLMLYNAPIGEVIWSGFPQIGKWILDVPQASVNRGLIITTGIGLAAYGIRYILGLEEMAEGTMT